MTAHLQATPVRANAPTTVDAPDTSAKTAPSPTLDGDWLVPTNRGWEACQRVAALLALLASAPVLLLAFAFVKLTSRGPFLFAQMRRGYAGKPFFVYKIRTLRHGAERSTALGVATDEPSVTVVGRVLRRLKIDELPQLWNVVTGTMNVVGPRPLPIALEDALTQQIPQFAERHRVKPGMSSFGQVSVVENRLGADLIADWSERFEAEQHYIRNKCAAYDLVVIALTGLYVLRSMLPFRRSASTATTPALGGTTRVLGTEVANLDYQGVVDVTADWIARRERQYVAICPVHSIVEAVLHRSHRDALQHAGLNTADGMPVVWAQRLLGHRHASRVYGPTLMLHLLERAATEGWRIGFYGDRQDVLERLAAKMQARFPKLQIACAISPPYRELNDEEDAAMVVAIRAAKPQLLFVAMGCPKQERWMFEHRERLDCVQFGVGAAFRFHTGDLEQAPAIVQRAGLEWLFRLACEPRRLFRRYATTNPIYVVLFSLQLAGHWLLRRNYQRPGGPNGNRHS